MDTRELNASVLQEAFGQVFEQPHFPEKLGWWLRFGFPAEHWLRFELGFRLGKILGDEYAVWYEKGKVDLVILQAQSPALAEDYKPLLNLELKVHGNWFSTPKVFKNINDDKEKIDDKYPDIPGASLVLWFLAKPKAGGYHDWISEQVDQYEPKNNSWRTLGMIEDRMKNECAGGYDLIRLHPVPNVESMFEVMDAHLFCYRNGLAKSRQLLQ